MSDDYEDDAEFTKCPDCDGSEWDPRGWGGKGNGVCSKCRGTGEHDQGQLWDTVDDIIGVDYPSGPCLECDGTKVCQTCNGEGIL